MKKAPNFLRLYKVEELRTSSSDRETHPTIACQDTKQHLICFSLRLPVIGCRTGRLTGLPMIDRTLSSNSFTN